MREIKFRAWDRYLEKMKYPKGVELSEFKCIEEEYPEWNPENIIWLQFTGLKDKNGREIYEGDLVLDHGYRGVVEFGNIERKQWGNQAMFYLNLTRGGGTGDKALFSKDSNYEIIGNIYETPELLTQPPRQEGKEKERE